MKKLTAGFEATPNYRIFLDWVPQEADSMEASLQKKEAIWGREGSYQIRIIKPVNLANFQKLGLLENVGRKWRMSSVLSHPPEEAVLFIYRFSIWSLLKTSSRSISSLPFLVCQPYISRLVPRPILSKVLVSLAGKCRGSRLGHDRVQKREGELLGHHFHKIWLWIQY